MVENTIICGDSLEVLKEQVDNSSVDLIITSPPYNIGMNYGAYKDDMPSVDYFNVMRGIFTECYRVLKDDGRVCLNVPSAIMHYKTRRVFFPMVDFIYIMTEIGFQYYTMITWLKAKHLGEECVDTGWGSFGSPSLPYIRNHAEPIIVFYKKSMKHLGEKECIDMTTEEFYKWSTNLWITDKDGESYNGVIGARYDFQLSKEHPAMFPESLVARLLKLFSYQGDLVLDPFNGSGTTTYMSAYHQRRWIGIDMDKEYCKFANNRMGIFR